jgi:putative oxidoreductase
MKKLINLGFLPPSADFGLLVLRLWFGLSIFVIHGLAKIQNLGGTVAMFRDKMGFHPALGTAAVLSESLCAILIAIGLATRLAATFLAITMAVAFIKVHRMVLTQGDPHSGEMAFLYLGAFVTLMFAGAGKFSVDAKVLD